MSDMQCPGEALPDPVAVVDDAFRSTTWPNQDTPRSCSWCWRVLPEHEAGCEAVELVALRRVAEAAKRWRQAWNEESGQPLAEQGLCHALNALESSSTPTETK